MQLFFPPLLSLSRSLGLFPFFTLCTPLLSLFLSSIVQFFLYQLPTLLSLFPPTSFLPFYPLSSTPFSSSLFLSLSCTQKDICDKGGNKVNICSVHPVLNRFFFHIPIPPSPRSYSPHPTLSPSIFLPLLIPLPISPHPSLSPSFFLYLAPTPIYLPPSFRTSSSPFLFTI